MKSYHISLLMTLQFHCCLRVCISQISHRLPFLIPSFLFIFLILNSSIELLFEDFLHFTELAHLFPQRWSESDGLLDHREIGDLALEEVLVDSSADEAAAAGVKTRTSSSDGVKT